MALLPCLLFLTLLTPSLAAPMPYRPAAISHRLQRRYIYYDEDAYQTRIIIGVVVSVVVFILCLVSWYVRYKRQTKIRKQQQELVEQQQQVQKLQHQLLQQEIDRNTTHVGVPAPAYQPPDSATPTTDAPQHAPKSSSPDGIRAA